MGPTGAVCGIGDVLVGRGRASVRSDLTTGVSQNRVLAGKAHVSNVGSG